MTIKIDKGIPIPPLGYRGQSLYPIRDMKVGDSFFSDARVATKFYTLAKRVGVRIATRREEVNGIQGFRIWRIADEPKKLRAVK